MMCARLALPLIGVVALASTACGASAGESAPVPPTHAPSTGRLPVGTPSEGPSKVLVVIEENHSSAQMRAGMPFLAGLSEEYGYATHWSAITHPSAPNYLAIAGGSTFGITDDASPAAHQSDIGAAPSVFDQALAAGRTAGTYAESMPKNCHIRDYPDRSQGVPTYAVRHNPWVYFSAGRDDCLGHDGPLGEFADDAAADRLPDVTFLIPDLEHDAHDGSLAAADAWLERQLGPVLRSDDFATGRLVVVVTADEDDRQSDNLVLTSVLTPALSHEVVDTPLTHYSLTRFIADVLGVEPLGRAASAPDMRAAFGL